MKIIFNEVGNRIGLSILPYRIAIPINSYWEINPVNYWDHDLWGWMKSLIIDLAVCKIGYSLQAFRLKSARSQYLLPILNIVDTYINTFRWRCLVGSNYSISLMCLFAIQRFPMDHQICWSLIHWSRSLQVPTYADQKYSEYHIFFPTVILSLQCPH